MTRPRVYTLAEAAARCGVTPRTIRSWMAPASPWRPERDPLEPIPDSWVLLGYHLFTEPALVAAELANANGRTRRKASARCDSSRSTPTNDGCLRHSE